MVYDNDPQVCKFISTPKEILPLNCAAFYAGIIEAILTANYYGCTVTAHFSATVDYPNRTVFLIKLSNPPKVAADISR
jgi:hypothetical protein